MMSLVLRVLRVLAVTVLFLLLYLGLRPEPVPKIIAHSDKWGHFIGFALLALSFFTAMPRWSKFALALALTMVGFAVELGQAWFLPRRSFDLADLAVNGCGVIAALVVYMLAVSLIERVPHCDKLIPRLGRSR